MAGARTVAGRRKASALRSARAASDDAAHSFAPFGALPPLIFLEANTSCRSLPKLGCGCIARTSELVRHPEVRAATGARAIAKAVATGHFRADRGREARRPSRLAALAPQG